MDLRWYDKMTYPYNNGTDREQYEKKHLLPHPYNRFSVVLAIIILMGFLPYITSNSRSEAEINATVDFLKAGGYEEEYYTMGYYVEFSSPDEKIIVEYMLEDVVSVQVGHVTYSEQAAKSYKKYGINFGTTPPDIIYKKLSEQYGYNSYKVYLQE